MRILVKSILHKPSFFIVLLLMPLLTAFALNYTKTNGVILHYGYTWEGEPTSDVMKTFREKLDTYHGLCVFDYYTNEEDMRIDISSGRLEGGYRIPGDLSERILAGRNRHSIQVFINHNTTTYKVIDMTLFGLFFEPFSLSVAEDLLLSRVSDSVNLDLYEDSFDYYGGEGSTFHFDFYEGASAEVSSSRLVFIGYLSTLLVLCIFFLVMAGYLNYNSPSLAQVKLRIPYGKSLLFYLQYMSVYLGSAFLMGGICLNIAKKQDAGILILHLALYLVILLVLLALFYLLKVSNRVIILLLPSYTLLNCLFCPAIFDLSAYIPVLSPIKYFLIVSLF